MSSFLSLAGSWVIILPCHSSFITWLKLISFRLAISNVFLVEITQHGPKMHWLILLTFFFVWMSTLMFLPSFSVNVVTVGENSQRVASESTLGLVDLVILSSPSSCCSAISFVPFIQHIVPQWNLVSVDGRNTGHLVLCNFNLRAMFSNLHGRNGMLLLFTASYVFKEILESLLQISYEAPDWDKDIFTCSFVHANCHWNLSMNMF